MKANQLATELRAIVAPRRLSELITLRLTPEQRKALRALGGSAWIRAQLDAARQKGSISLELLGIAAMFGAALALAVYGVPVREDYSSPQYECIRVDERPPAHCVEYRPRRAAK